MPVSTHKFPYYARVAGNYCDAIAYFELVKALPSSNWATINCFYRK